MSTTQPDEAKGGTPRTDANAKQIFSARIRRHVGINVVEADFARTLERELTALQARCAELEAKLAVALRGAELLAKEAADQHRELDAVATTIEERTEGHAVVYSDRLRPHAKAIRALLATKEPDNK